MASSTGQSKQRTAQRGSTTQRRRSRPVDDVGYRETTVSVPNGHGWQRDPVIASAWAHGQQIGWMTKSGDLAPCEATVMA
ncbi:MAG TPA: hypothetical protein PLV68_03950 [Ilumatobacteraceae bacterium]|nr:hypothetical protein [Ilumatobacteraceae bacterium]